MNHEEELRIGICACSPFYHGELEGQTIILPDISTTLRITESVVSDDDYKHRPSIRNNRIHFFLDVHHVGNAYHTQLALINLYPKKGQSDHIFIGTTAKYTDTLEQNWEQARPPSIEVILAAAPEIMLKKGVKRFESWIARMTPEGWVRPE